VGQQNTAILKAAVQNLKAKIERRTMAHADEGFDDLNTPFRLGFG